jgi:hypothetical protein
MKVLERGQVSKIQDISSEQRAGSCGPRPDWHYLEFRGAHSAPSWRVSSAALIARQALAF